MVHLQNNTEICGSLNEYIIWQQPHNTEVYSELKQIFWEKNTTISKDR